MSGDSDQAALDWMRRAREAAAKLAAWDEAYWCWVHDGDGGDMARLAGPDPIAARLNARTHPPEQERASDA